MNENLKTFGEAIEALKEGKSVCRDGWNGKNMSLFLQKGSEAKNVVYPDDMENCIYIQRVKRHLFEKGDDDTARRFPCINMITPNHSIVTGWLASQTDMLAEDWIILD